MSTEPLISKVAVFVKNVPEGRVVFDAAVPRIDRTRNSTMNAFDENTVEEALRLKDATGIEVVAISMGPPQAVDSLRKALALGVDRAVLLSDEALVGSDLLATSAALAKVLERESAELVLFGQQSSDGGGGVLWAAVAERLGMPFVSQATELRIADTVRVRRQTEVGYDLIEVELPAIVAVSDAINEPRYASLKGMMGAKKKPCDVITVAELGLDPAEVGVAGSGTSVLALGEPPSRGGSRKIEDDGNAAQAIFDFLVERQLV